MKKSGILSAIVAASIMAGCVTDPTTGQQRPSKAAIGAVTGAAAGALVAKSNADKDKMGRAALIGAALGGGVGYYMDRQAAKLKEQMQGTGVTVEKNAQGGIDLVMPNNITFAFNSSAIESGFKPTLDKLAGTLKEFDKTTIKVAGYTDNVGSAAYNQNLSQQRAGNVAQYLMNSGVPSNRIDSVGYGMSNPVATNSTESGRAQNRRVEISIAPPTSVS